MSFKYDLDKLLDPCGIEKLHKTITRITKPRNEYSAMSSAMEALEKATQPWNKNSVIGAAMANVAGPWDHKSAAMEAIKKYASSITINESLGLEADTQKILAATTLMPDLKTKIQSLHHKNSKDL